MNALDYSYTLPSPRPDDGNTLPSIADQTADTVVDSLHKPESGVFPKAAPGTSGSKIEKILLDPFRLRRGDIRKALGDEGRDYTSFAERIQAESELVSARAVGGDMGASAYVLGQILENLGS